MNISSHTLRIAGIILGVILHSYHVCSMSWYVAPGGSNETGTGAIDKPFASIEKACTLVGPGDTLLLRGGVYNQLDRINPNTNGTPDKPIVIRNYPGETPVIDGTGINLNNNDALLFIGRWTGQPWMTHIILEGITVRNSSERGISFYKTRNLTIRNCLLHDYHKRGIGGYGEQILVENNTIFNGSLMNRGGSMGNQGWPIQIQPVKDYDTGMGCRDIIIRNNLVHSSWGEAMCPGSGTRNALIEGNTMYDIWSVGIYCNKASQVIVRNNHVYNKDPQYYRSGHPANGIGYSNETSFSTHEPVVHDIYIYNNVVSNNRRGISFWYDNSNNAAQNSYYNIFIAYNVIYNPTQYGLYIDPVPSSNNQPTGCILKNNIIYKGSNQTAIGNLSGWSISHNNWAGGMPSFGQTASISADPQFVKPGITEPPAGFRLSSTTSPSYRKGIPLPEITSVDFWQHSRDTNHPSMGIHELQPVSRSVETAGDHAFYIYPVPATDAVTLFFPAHLADSRLTLEIIDPMGKSHLLVNNPRPTQKIQVGSLKSGIYILKCYREGNLVQATPFTKL